MCQSKEQGGKRCDCDTNNGRRLRRKASETVNTPIPTQRYHSIDEGDVLSLEEIAAKSKDIRDSFSQSSSEEKDAENEKTITQVGASILHYADKLPSTLSSEDKKLLREQEEEIKKGKAQLKSPLPPPAKKSLTQRLAVLEEKKSFLEQKDENKRILTVLREVRDFGGELKFSDKSSPEMSGFYQREITPYYPSSWLGKSNAHHQDLNLVSHKLKDLGGMAGAYFHDAVSGEKTGEQVSVNRTQTHNLSGDDESVRNLRTYLKQKGVEVETYALDRDGKESTQLAVFKTRKHKGYNHKVDNDEWEMSTGPESIIAHYSEVRGKGMTPSELGSFAKKNPVWVAKDNTTRYKVEGNLVVASDLPDGEKKAVAIHELGHRMEKVLPDNRLPRMERAFLRRRSGLRPGDAPTYKEVGAVGGYSERIGVCYPTDVTTTEYASKTYLNGTSEEVFTVGIENVFGIRKSGDRISPDKDYKSFIVGTLGTL